MKAQSLHRVMFGLLYPAVLGGVFVSFVDAGVTNIGAHPKFIFGVIFLIHWTLNFAYMSSQTVSERYSLSKFGGELTLVVGMNLAFYSLPSQELFEHGSPDYTGFFLGISLIGIGFVGREMYDRIAVARPIRVRAFTINLSLALSGGSLFLASKFVPSIASSDVAVFVLIAWTLITSVLFLSWARR